MAQRAMKPRKMKPGQVEQVSSPGKVYHSRASKPSAVAAMEASDDLVGVDGVGDNAAPLVETEERLDALEAKMNELIAALKK